MSKNIDIFIDGIGKETLTQNNYKASGGEGSIYQKGDTAFKIMHPGHQIIPKKKIEELNKINADNVLIPLRYIFDNHGTPIGFTMKFVQGTESLCKVFNMGFKQKNGLSPQDIADLVKEMQKTLQKVHDANILVVDFNQMNFLVDGKTFKNPYFIDTDSYQTPSFKATAIMECIRDRSVPKGNFTKLTDWFSWGVVAFWLYIGTHPYRGGHPNYSMNDWNGKRMDDNVSIFDPDVTTPANCLPFSVIPKPHLDWFKDVFVNKTRSIPPLPDGHVVVAVGITPKTMADFIVKEIFAYDSLIRDIFFDNGSRYVVSKRKVWKDDVCVLNFDVKYDTVGFSKIEDGDYPLFVSCCDDKVSFYDFNNKNVVADMKAEKIMFYNGKVYTKTGNRLIEHKCSKIYNRTIHSVKEIANIFGSACNLFEGVVTQDIVGNMWLLIPNIAGNFVNVAVPELDGHRVTDAKFCGDTCVLIAEKRGSVYRFVISFSKSREKYDLRKMDAEIGDSADFVVKSTGVCVSPIEGGDLETWAGNQSRIFKKSPIPMGALLFNDNNVTVFAVNNKLYSVEKK